MEKGTKKTEEQAKLLELFKVESMEELKMRYEAGNTLANLMLDAVEELKMRYEAGNTLANLMPDDVEELKMRYEKAGNTLANQMFKLGEIFDKLLEIILL